MTCSLVDSLVYAVLFCYVLSENHYVLLGNHYALSETIVLYQFVIRSF